MGVFNGILPFKIVFIGLMNSFTFGPSSISATSYLPPLLIFFGLAADWFQLVVWSRVGVESKNLTYGFPLLAANSLQLILMQLIFTQPECT